MKKVLIFLSGAAFSAAIAMIVPREGGYVNHPSDRGGPTNRGVTLKTWQSFGYDKNGDGVIDSSDVRLLTWDDAAFRIYKPHYWDKCRASEIANQSIAVIVVDWYIMSGPSAIRMLQEILYVQPDGVVGNVTLDAINRCDPRELHKKIAARRRLHFENIVKKDPTQRVFLKGWLNRLESYRYEE